MIDQALRSLLAGVPIGLQLGATGTGGAVLGLPLLDGPLRLALGFLLLFPFALSIPVLVFLWDFPSLLQFDVLKLFDGQIQQCLKDVAAEID